MKWDRSFSEFLTTLFMIRDPSLNFDHSSVILSVQKQEKNDEANTTGNCYQGDYPF